MDPLPQIMIYKLLRAQNLNVTIDGEDLAKAREREREKERERETRLIHNEEYSPYFFLRINFLAVVT